VFIASLAKYVVVVFIAFVIVDIVELAMQVYAALLTLYRFSCSDEIVTTGARHHYPSHSINKLRNLCKIKKK